MRFVIRDPKKGRNGSVLPEQDKRQKICHCLRRELSD